MKKKKKTSPQKEKALQKTERESFRFQMKWEAKKLYPEHTDELPARVEAECAIIEDANLLPDLQAGADFLQKFRMQFGDFARMTYSSFLKNSIVAQCIGLTPACAEGESALPIFTQDMLSEPLQINILLDLSALPDACKWMKRNLDVLSKTPEGFEVKKGVLTFFFLSCPSYKPLPSQKHRLCKRKWTSPRNIALNRKSTLTLNRKNPMICMY